MKRFSAHYILTNSGPPKKRAIINTEDDGTIINVENTDSILHEESNVEFHNGIIIPGFVNCHCHLELSHLKGFIKQGIGLGGFIERIRNTRDENNEKIISSAIRADKDMYSEGVNLCADICNTPLSFNLKKESRIKYINLLEVFGIDPEKADLRMTQILGNAKTAEEMNLPFSIVPHSVYSISLPLFRLLAKNTHDNKITSIHFMETAGEKQFLENHTGPIMESYEKSGLVSSRPETVKNHADAILNEITLKGNLILVHNTFADRETIKKIKERENLFWCLCPNSNIYIENELPPIELLINEECDIVIGTDSLASNSKLSILDEIKMIQHNFPLISLEELIKWATVNGARALGEVDKFGTIEPGKKPGLLLLQNTDLRNLKLLPDSFVTRLA